MNCEAIKIEELVQVKRYRVGARGERGVVVSLPPTWLRKHGIKPGDDIEFMEAAGRDELVLRKIVKGRRAS